MVTPTATVDADNVNVVFKEAPEFVKLPLSSLIFLTKAFCIAELRVSPSVVFLIDITYVEDKPKLSPTEKQKLKYALSKESTSLINSNDSDTKLALLIKEKKRLMNKLHL